MPASVHAGAEPSSRRYQTSERGRKRRRGQAEPESKPIQSRRTSGDGRTRNRRKR